MSDLRRRAVGTVAVSPPEARRAAGSHRQRHGAPVTRSHAIGYQREGMEGSR